jgi:hypothetical protein
MEKKMKRKIGYENKIGQKKQWGAKGRIGFGWHIGITNTRWTQYNIFESDAMLGPFIWCSCHTFDPANIGFSCCVYQTLKIS